MFSKDTTMVKGSMVEEAKVLGKMDFTKPTFQCPCKRNLSGNRMRYNPGRLSGNVCRLALLGNTM